MTPTTPDELEWALGALGYPGFGHRRLPVRPDPADVLLYAVRSSDLDARLVEGLPWVLATYPDLDWPRLRDGAVAAGVQNRLGYLVGVARDVATRWGRTDVVQTWAARMGQLEAVRLDREDTLCRRPHARAERNWLLRYRPTSAVHWGLVTDITADQLSYADG